MSVETVKVLGAALQPGGNSPTADGRRTPCRWRLELLLDALPTSKDYRYTALPRDDRSTLYVALQRGVASFMLHDKRDERGYGGSLFNLTLDDGNSIAIRGPWSSSTETVNATSLFPPLVPAAATASPDDWQRGYTFYALSGVTVDVVRQAMAFLPGWQFNEQAVLGATPPHGRNSALSGEQLAVVESGQRDELFTYTPGLPICEQCGGHGSIEVPAGTPKSFEAATGKHVLICSKCSSGVSMWSGSRPVPGTRHHLKLVA